MKKSKKIDVNKEKKELVLFRFKSLNPLSKIQLGSNKAITVRELIEHIEKEDSFGQKIIEAQIRMLRILANGA